MKLDLMIYGRGQDRLEGYQTFAAPSYWTEQMLMTMDRFNDLWNCGDLSASQPEAFSAEVNPWGKTYMFVCMPPPYCCALLRCTRVEGDEPGTWLKEVRNADIWSLEGVCCPYEQKENFIALLPSIILWLEQDNTSFYGRLRRGQIEKQIELPYDSIINPYAEGDVEIPRHLRDTFSSDNALDALYSLCQNIKYSSAPFHFLFGPLADYFNSEIGTHYGVTKVFSTLRANDSADTFSDPMMKMENTRKRDFSRRKLKYVLQMNTFKDKKIVVTRNWSLVCKDPNSTAEPIFSDTYTIQDQTISVSELLAQADFIRSYAKHQLCWENTMDNSDAEMMFSFIKEE